MTTVQPAQKIGSRPDAQRGAMPVHSEPWIAPAREVPGMEYDVMEQRQGLWRASQEGYEMATDEVRSARAFAGMRASAAAPSADAPLPAPAQRALSFGLLLSAVRCSIQYVLLPFVLPWIGVTGAIPPWLTLALGTLAVAALARNLRTLWRLRHAQRWNYLFLAL